MNKPTMWVLVGLSGSGKSTIATQIANENPNTIIVSSDAIREELTGNYEDQEHNEEVFKIFHNRIRKNLENKKNVIADATNLTMKSRRAIMMRVNGLNVRKVCVIIPKPFGQCKKDNLHREHPVPDFVLNKQIMKFQIPFYNEGFSEIILYNRNDNLEEYQIGSINLFFAMWGFNQKTPYHNMTLDEHCLNIYNLFCKKIPNKTLLSLEYTNGFAMGAKLHDFGKLMVQTFDENGVAHYYGHENAGSYFILSQMIKPLVWTDDMLLDCCFLINYHMMPFGWKTDKAKQRWKERFGEYKYKMLLDFNECDRAR
nr:MAG TPA: AAA domain protein [Caudoviricetes sp.]